jgi:hypothetical protein
MCVRDDGVKRLIAILRSSLAAATVIIPLIALTGTPDADAQTLSRAITVASDPPGATVWKKEGTTLTCMDTVTPGTVELKFHAANDLQKIRLRKFGYKGRNLDVKPTDDKVNAALGDPAPDSFVVTDDAKPELKQLNDGLQKEFEKTIFADPEALRCVPFELSFVHVMDDEGDLTLGVAITLDRSFGGPAFRVASHAGNRDERRQKMAQVTLENGVADLLARVHRIAAKFPNLKVITILCSYPTTEAFLDTIQTTFTGQHLAVSNNVLKPGGGYGMGTTMQTFTGHGEYTLVKDRDVERIIKFVMPAAQIPDTRDKKTISDAVLAVGKISLAETSDSSSQPPSSPR